MDLSVLMHLRVCGEIGNSGRKYRLHLLWRRGLMWTTVNLLREEIYPERTAWTF